MIESERKSSVDVYSEGNVSKVISSGLEALYVGQYGNENKVDDGEFGSR